MTSRNFRRLGRQLPQIRWVKFGFFAGMPTGRIRKPSITIIAPSNNIIRKGLALPSFQSGTVPDLPRLLARQTLPRCPRASAGPSAVTALRRFTEDPMPAKATKSTCNNQSLIQAPTSPRRRSRLGVADEPCSIAMSDVTTTTLEEIMNARGWNGDFTPRFLSAITPANPQPTQRSTAIESYPEDLVAASTSRLFRHAR